MSKFDFRAILSYSSDIEYGPDIELSGIYPLFEDHKWENDPIAIKYIEQSVNIRAFNMYNSYQMRHDYCLSKEDYNKLKLQLYNFYAKDYYHLYLNKCK